MSHRRFALLIIIVTLLSGSVIGQAQTPPTPDDRLAAVETHQAQHHELHVAAGVNHPSPPAATTTAVPSPASTLVPSPPSSPVPPTSTPAVAAGWHAPGSHSGLNVHEHGIVAPPAWVNASGNPAFTQSRESHTGYKGVYDVSPGGVESYFIGHIFSSEFARSHGDHDYQLWLRDPETGAVFYVAGILNFGSPGITDPMPERLRDTGERPIALSVNDAGCETWYNRPGSTVIDIGWTMCGRYQAFDGTIRGGVGTFRTIDWVIPCSRLPAGNVMLNNCRVEFGVSRLSFLANNVENDPGHVARPIN